MTHDQFNKVIQDHNLPENFCVLPFLGLECKTTGEASACCVQQEVAKNELGKAYNFSDNTITEVFDSKWIKNLRNDFLDNQQVKSCYNCWDEERAGLVSKRMRELVRFQDNVDTVIAEPKIKYLDLKFGNICNLKCRICTSFASSKWAEEEEKLELAPPGHGDRMIKMGKWPKENDNFWTDLYEVSNDVEVLELFGGEPMVLKEHALYLKQIVDSGTAGNKIISYNTNGTQDMSRFYEQWKHFKKVQVFFSIDGIGKRFTYLRHPADWDTVNNNIKHLLESDIKNLEVSFFCSVSAFNIWYLEEVADWAKQYPAGKLHWNMVYVPHHYSAKCLPKKAKSIVREHLSNSKYSADFANIIKYIEDVDEDQTMYFIQFRDWLKKIDESRNESFVDTFPEYAEALNEFIRK